MLDPVEKISDMAIGLVNAASRRKSIGNSLQKKGFLSLGKGAWLGFRGNDVVSGLLVEGGASDVYISSFILPVFDELSFVSWSLGRRLIHCSKDVRVESECYDAIGAYIAEIGKVRSTNDILNYLTSTKKDGFYPVWVRYMCYLRNCSLEEARAYLTHDMQEELHSSVLKRFFEISSYVSTGDISGVEKTLGRWESVSRKTFGHGDFLVRISD